jgi:hypothetical protein
MKKYNLVAEHLVKEQKITLVHRSEFGGVSATQTTYLGCRPAPHYENCPDDRIGVAIFHKPRTKRKARYRTIPFSTPLIVYNGWRDIDTDALVFRQLGDDLKESRHTMFDDRFFTELLAAIPGGVIFSDIPGGDRDG